MRAVLGIGVTAGVTILVTVLILVLTAVASGLALASWRRTGETRARAAACWWGAGGVTLLAFLHRQPWLLLVILALAAAPLLLAHRERPGTPVRLGSRFGNRLDSRPGSGSVRIVPERLAGRWRRAISEALDARAVLREVTAAAAPGALREELGDTNAHADALVVTAWSTAQAGDRAEQRAARLGGPPRAAAERGLARLHTDLVALVDDLSTAAAEGVALTAQQLDTGSDREQAAALSDRLEALRLAAEELRTTASDKLTDRRG